MKVVTWNMQGGTNAAYLNAVIQNTQPNVLCIQETGNLTPLLKGTAPIAGFPGSLYGNFAAGYGFYECVFWKNGNWTQGGVAILSNISPAAKGIQVAAAAPYAPAIPRNLPWMRILDPATGGTATFFSIHSPPVWDNVTIGDVCSWTNAQVAAVQAGVPGSWVIAGDFNADPQDPGFVGPPAGNVVRGPNATQQGGGILDYSITNVAGYAFVEAGKLVGASDHYPQEFQM